MGLNTSKYVITKTTQLKDTWYRLIFNNTSWKKIYDNVSTAPGSPTFQNFIKEKLLERGFLDVDFGSASSVSWMLDGVDDVRIRAEGGADSLNYFLDWTGILRVKIPKTNCIIKFKDKNNNVVLLTPENEQYQIGNINNGTWQSQYQKDLDPNLSNEERWVNLSRIGAEFAVAQDESSEIKNKGIFYLSSEDERYYQTDAPNPSTDHKKWFSIPLYEISFGIEQVEPYTWTTEQGKSWTPNQLKFPSMVKYSNILNENKNDSGRAVSLPEVSSAADASNYEQDENGYCYIKDDEENIVYNKFLNQFARKTKINNGYRVNGNQSLELMSFNNNIYDYDKQPGQYLFNGNKKQTYGSKENANQTIQKQNVPYFGGQPAIYPIVLYDNSNTIDDNPMSTLTLTVTSQSISFDNQTWRNFSAGEDLLVAAIRREGEWTAEKAPNWKIKRLSGETEVNMAGKNDTFYFEITDFAQKGTLAMKDFEFYEVEPGSYTIYQENKIEKMPFTKKIKNSAIKNLYIIDNDKTWNSDIKYVSDHAVGKDSSGRTAGKNFKIFLGQYNDDKATWQDHLNLKMNFQVNNIRFIKPYSSEEKLFYGSGEPSEKEGATGSQANNTCTAYVTWDIQNRTDSDNLNHDTGAAWSGTIEDFLAIGRIQRVFYAVPGSFPSFISYFPADDEKHIIIHNTTSDKIEWYKTYSSQQHLNYDSQNDSNNSTSAYYNYKYRLQTGGSTYPNAWSVYLKVGYINNAYRPYALALILIKNGKLLNIS